jgi:Helix-turn-helix domain
MASSPGRRWRVLEALLWDFHNAKGGLCFPNNETIAETAHCARSTVAEAIESRFARRVSVKPSIAG